MEVSVVPGKPTKSPTLHTCVSEELDHMARVQSNSRDPETKDHSPDLNLNT